VFYQNGILSSPLFWRETHFFGKFSTLFPEIFGDPSIWENVNSGTSVVSPGIYNILDFGLFPLGNFPWSWFFPPVLKRFFIGVVKPRVFFCQRRETFFLVVSYKRVKAPLFGRLLWFDTTFGFFSRNFWGKGSKKRFWWAHNFVCERVSFGRKT